jgi:hypothetical protein
LQKQLASQELLIIPCPTGHAQAWPRGDELGFVPLSKTGAELLFEVISQRDERGSIIIGARRCGYDASPPEKLGQRRALTIDES